PLLSQEGEEAWVMLGRTGSLGAFGPGQDDSEDVIILHGAAFCMQKLCTCSGTQLEIRIMVSS
ncbi:hypothetical protein ABK046_52680, partial [Streptomyces caeruleatus]